MKYVTQKQKNELLASRNNELVQEIATLKAKLDIQTKRGDRALAMVQGLSDTSSRASELSRELEHVADECQSNTTLKLALRSLHQKANAILVNAQKRLDESKQ